MEIIRKKISLEQSKIHLNGGLPYIPYNEEYTEILSCNTEPITIVEWEHDSMVEKQIYESNYGNFQCDITPDSPFFQYIEDCCEISLVTTDDDDTQYIRSTNLIRRYNQLLTILRNGLHLKHVKNESCKDTGDYTETYLDNFTYNGISGDTTYGFLREAVPVDMFDEDGEQQFTNMANGTYLGPVVDNADYVIVLDNYEEFVALGGKQLIELVDSLLVDLYTGSTITVNTEEYIAPYISIPVLLTSCEDSLGVMTPYQDENEFIFNGELSYDVANKYNPDISGGSLYDEDRIYEGVLDWKLKPTEISEITALTNEVLVESQLPTLRVSKYYTSEDNEVLPGLFVENTNPFFKCTYKTGTSASQGEKHYEKNGEERGRLISETPDTKPYGETNVVEILPYGPEIEGTPQVTDTEIIVPYTREYKWWEIENVSGDNLKCADGEDIVWNTNDKYKTITVFNSLMNYITESGEVQPGSYYHFLIKYNNSSSSPMTVPYVVGEVVNRGFDKLTSAYTGDYIISMEESDDEISFEYVVGASFVTQYDEQNDKYTSDFSTVVEDTGVYYKETHPYEKSVSAVTVLDGIETIYWYNKINLDDSTSLVYSEDLNLNRTAVITLADSLVVGDVWKKDGTVINTPLIKEEYLMSASMDAITNIDVSIDRGNATAFEKHLILGECNSFQDLLNYRNNIYNL